MNWPGIAAHLEILIAVGPRRAFDGFCCYAVWNAAWIGFASYHGQGGKLAASSITERNPS
jgi:hypothetical protein